MSNLYLSHYAADVRTPGYCHFTIDGKSNINFKLIKLALIQKGLAIIKLSFHDNEAEILQDIVSNIGEAHEHDDKGRIIWDVKVGGQDGMENLAISHSDNEFVFHNDCAFEQKIPDFIGLQAVKADIYGGGHSVLISVDSLIEKLSPQSYQTLLTQKYRILVPLEFKKDINQINATLIDNNNFIRYRKDIIDRTACNQEQLDALDELELKMALPDNMAKLMLNSGEILLLDNRRYLHARTKILDKSRHLKRVRFNMPDVNLN